MCGKVLAIGGSHRVDIVDVEAQCLGVDDASRRRLCAFLALWLEEPAQASDLHLAAIEWPQACGNCERNASPSWKASSRLTSGAHAR